MNIAIVSCVQLGLSCLEEIIKSDCSPKVCITLKDNLALKKSGRVFFDDVCKKNKINLIKINNINDKRAVNCLLEFEIEWLLIIGWSQIAGEKIIDSVKKGVLGIHPTLLPKGRGRAPIPWAIIKNLKYTGATLFKINKDIDNGDIVSQKKIKIQKNETATTLYNKIDNLQIQLVRKIIPKLKNNELKSYKQDESKATYWPKRSPTDGEINTNMSVSKAYRFINALTHPYPGAYLWIDDRKITIWKGKITIKKTKNFCIKFRGGYIECINWSEEPIK